MHVLRPYPVLGPSCHLPKEPHKGGAVLESRLRAWVCWAPLRPLLRPWRITCVPCAHRLPISSVWSGPAGSGEQGVGSPARDWTAGGERGRDISSPDPLSVGPRGGRHPVPLPGATAPAKRPLSSSLQLPPLPRRPRAVRAPHGRQPQVLQHPSEESLHATYAL